MIIVNILLYLLLLTLLVLVHELGHYLAARKNKVLVEEFGVGIPPRAKGWKKGETLWSLNWLPIGGFVKLYGDGVAGESGQIDEKLASRAFVNAKPWAKIQIIVAGVVFNILFAWFLTTILFVRGTEVSEKGVKVSEVNTGSPAAAAGIQPGDVIIQLTDSSGVTKTIELQRDLQAAVGAHKGSLVTLTTIRNGQQYHIALTPRLNPPPGEGAVGIRFNQNSTFKQYNVFVAPVYAAQETGINLARMTYEILSLPAKLLTPHTPGEPSNVEVAGPIGIFKIFEDLLKIGWEPIIQFMILISLNLAVFNILPIPALDGGRLLFPLYELITKKRPNYAIEARINSVGFMLLLALAAIIAIKDIMKLGN